LVTDLIQNNCTRGVDIVTLRSSFEAYKLYERLGFKPYYEQQLFSFQEA